jgi:molybdate transport system ATP-binding protein
MRVRLQFERADFRLDVDLELPERGVTSVFGRSGAGKTTLLRCLAGLERGRGRLEVGGELWQDEELGRYLAPAERRVGYVFQEPSLFAHLDVRGNLRYGEKRTPLSERRIAFEEAVAWLELAHLLARQPASLSRGERQRVAVARALLVGPRLLLMDEPLASLDEVSRREILPYFEDLHARLEIPVVYVSHALREVARLADHVVYLEAGRELASGPASEVLTRLDLAQAEDEGLGAVVTARVEAHDDDFALTSLSSPFGELRVRRLARPVGAHVRVQILARDVSLSRAPDLESTILNVFETTILEMQEVGLGQVMLCLGPAGGDGDARLLARITRRSAVDLALQGGQRLWARVKSVSLME